MKLHILGVCGTFMGGLAQIASKLGYQVTGSDQHVYPPMSDQLTKAGIDLMEGYAVSHLKPTPDNVIVGNAISRGNPVLEYILNEQIPFSSGPEWLYQNVLKDKHVLAISGTHGKTTTTTMLSWILEYAGLNPGFLIGGVAENFGVSARYTDSDFFVIEADEYDTAFSDKRSKFIHYHPQTLVINNIEFDHADIFRDIGDIKREFHHLIRVLPQQARIIYPSTDEIVTSVLDMGCWSEKESFSSDSDTCANWTISDNHADFHRFKVKYQDENECEVNGLLLGEHNANNALAAIAAAKHVGVPVTTACEALSQFKSVKRRLECLFESNGTRVYDDFAHHPTAINKTLTALRQHTPEQRIIVILELRSNTMRAGCHAETLAASLAEADQVFLFQADDVIWDIAKHMSELGERCQIFDNTNAIVDAVAITHQDGDQIVIMSNGSFAGIHKQIVETLK